jgi:TRAP-type C4-dicarboxylate transport system permease small subunit
VKSLLSAIDRLLIVIVGILLVAVLAVVSLQVVMRYVFNAPTVWSEELATLLFVWFVMLGIGPVLKHQEHIKVEVLTELPSIWLKRLLHLLGNLVFIIVFAVLGYYALQLLPSADRQLMSGLSMALGANVQMSVLYWAVPIGSAFVILFGLEKLFEPAHNSAPELDGER